MPVQSIFLLAIPTMLLLLSHIFFVVFLFFSFFIEYCVNKSLMQAENHVKLWYKIHLHGHWPWTVHRSAHCPALCWLLPVFWVRQKPKKTKLYPATYCTACTPRMPVDLRWLWHFVIIRTLFLSLSLSVTASLCVYLFYYCSLHRSPYSYSHIFINILIVHMPMCIPHSIRQQNKTYSRWTQLLMRLLHMHWLSIELNTRVPSYTEWMFFLLFLF